MASIRRLIAGAAAALCLVAAPPAGAQTRAGAAPADDALAKTRFGAVVRPSGGDPSPIGSYARGCLAGAAELAADGPHHAAMRLSRNRRFGHPETIAFVRELAAKAHEIGLPGLLVGDLSQPRGGPMPYGHTSHQNGLDVDIWFLPMPQPRPAHEARETLAFRTVLNEARTGVDPEHFTPEVAGMLATAASDPRVTRIFVHPIIKRAMCDMAWADRSFLRRLRPWWGHHEHFHVRLACPAGASACRAQSPPPAGEGCGAPLDYWFTPAPYTPKADATPKPPLTVARMPAACRALLTLPPAE